MKRKKALEELIRTTSRLNNELGAERTGELLCKYSKQFFKENGQKMEDKTYRRLTSYHMKVYLIDKLRVYGTGDKQ